MNLVIDERILGQLEEVKQDMPDGEIDELVNCGCFRGGEVWGSRHLHHSGCGRL